MSRDRGSAATEMVLLTPVLVMLLLLVVHGGRSGSSLAVVRHAADQGARAAALVSASHMGSTARAAVLTDIESVGGICHDVAVDSVYSPGRPGSVTVSVSCSISTTGTGLLGLTSRRVSASSTEIVDRYRGGE